MPFNEICQVKGILKINANTNQEDSFYKLTYDFCLFTHTYNVFFSF